MLSIDLTRFARGLGFFDWAAFDQGQRQLYEGWYRQGWIKQSLTKIIAALRVLPLQQLTTDEIAGFVALSRLGGIAQRR